MLFLIVKTKIIFKNQIKQLAKIILSFFNASLQIALVVNDVGEKKEHLNKKKKTHQKAIIESLCWNLSFCSSMFIKVTSRNERRSTKTCISILLISGICSCPLLVRLSLRERLPVPPHSVLMTASASILCQMSSSKWLRIMSNIPVNVYSAVVLYYWIHNWQILKI